MDDFINLKLGVRNLDIFYIRKSILEVMTNNMHLMNGELLDFGCGKMPYKKFVLDNSKVEKYVGLDMETALEYDAAIRPDATWDGKVMPFEPNSFNCAFGTEVLEHCPDPEIVLKEVHRVLKKDGLLFFTVPFLWNLHEVPHDEYRYTPFSLQRHLENSGFRDIEIKATGGWHASMAQMLGLWVRRSPIHSLKRKLLSFLLKPIIKRLIVKDSKSTTTFNEGQMITGLYGTAKK
jgi:SAM-dependent methyltransferase